MHDPAHPGQLLAGWIEDLGVSLTAFAAQLGISRVMLSRVINGRSVVSAEMDLKLADALGTSPGYWLSLQVQRDLWVAKMRRHGRLRSDQRGGSRLPEACATANDRIEQDLSESIEQDKAVAPGSASALKRRSVDVKALRLGLGLTRQQFAARFGVSSATLRHWERGDRSPQGPALVLLNIIDRNPEALLEAAAV